MSTHPEEQICLLSGALTLSEEASYVLRLGGCKTVTELDFRSLSIAVPQFLSQNCNGNAELLLGSGELVNSLPTTKSL